MLGIFRNILLFNFNLYKDFAFIFLVYCLFSLTEAEIAHHVAHYVT